jgi:hypothetical protein
MPFRQGEILSNVLRIRLDLQTMGTATEGILLVTHVYAIVLTQDCDLEQDFRVRYSGGALDRSDLSRQIPNVLLGNVTTAEELKTSNKLQGDLWRRVPQNKDERYHFLQAVEPGCDAQSQGLPEMAIDFKRYFTVPTDELYQRVERQETQRRCGLKSPYLEHLSGRFAFFLSRVALPEDHFSEPVAK